MLCALASDDGPDLLHRRQAGRGTQALHSRGAENAELKSEALRLGRELLRGTKYDD
jgi:hypothetical protein